MLPFQGVTNHKPESKGRDGIRREALSITFSSDMDRKEEEDKTEEEEEEEEEELIRLVNSG